MHLRPSGTVTFLFSDIEGSTRLWERHPEAMANALARHDEILRQAIEAHRGYVFKTVGDAFYAAFDEAQHAVLAAIDGQRALLAEPWDERAVIRVRMALHTGAAEQRDGDYLGPTLNHCARLLDVVWARQIVITEATYELVSDLLPPDVLLRDLGLHRLTDLRRAEHLYQVVAPGLPEDFPPLRSLDTLPNNLPVRRSSFVGREAIMAQVQQLARTASLLTLTGPGGTGKTRLALQVAAALLPEFPDGVWYVELASLSDPGLVASRIASALRLSEEPGRPILETLVDHLRPRRLLLLLDNCEHLAGACAEVAQELLERCPHLRLLATSREPLGIEGETIFVVPGLSLPADDSHLETESALSLARSSEAVRLFVDRARAVSPEFELTEENALAILELCRRLDGLPLAIELAAARVRMMSPEQILARLDDRFELLVDGRRTAEPRQQTLRATLDWSHDLLSPSEQQLFRRLAVFRGGWSLAAAEAIVADCSQIGEDVLAALAGLVAKSMVKVVDHGGETRYDMLLTMQDYAAQKLAASGEAVAIRDCHAQWFVQLAERAAAELSGPEQVRWLEQLDTERDNLRAAFAWLLVRASGPLGMVQVPEGDGPAAAERTAQAESGLASSALPLVDRWLVAAAAEAKLQPDPAAVGPLLRLAAALAPYWEQRALLREGRAYLRLALGVPGTEAHPRLVAATRIALGSLELQLGNYPEAIAQTESGLSVAAETGDRRLEATALANLGTMAQHQSCFEGARDYFERALAIWQEIDDRPGVAAVIHSLGILAREQGEYVAARSYLNQALAIRRELGDQAGIAASLNALATLSFGQADYEAARALFGEALAIARSLNDRRAIAFVLNNLGRVAYAQGDLATARSCLEESLSVRRAIGDRRGIATVLNNLGRVALAEGKPDEAWQLVRESAVIRRELNDLVGIAETLEAAGQVWATSGDRLGAARLAGAAELLRENRGAPLAPGLAASMSSWLGKLRSELGAETFDAAFADGCQSSWQAALDMVIQTESLTAEESSLGTA